MRGPIVRLGSIYIWKHEEKKLSTPVKQPKKKMFLSQFSLYWNRIHRDMNHKYDL